MQLTSRVAAGMLWLTACGVTLAHAPRPTAQAPAAPAAGQLAPAAGRIDSFKVVYGSDRGYYTAMAPTTLAEKNAVKVPQQSIRIIAGTEDALFPGAQFIHETLGKLNIPHEFLPVPKSPHNHDQLLQYQTFDTMAFYGKVFAKLGVGPQSAGR